MKNSSRTFLENILTFPFAIKHHFECFFHRASNGYRTSINKKYLVCIFYRIEPMSYDNFGS